MELQKSDMNLSNCIINVSELKFRSSQKYYLNKITFMKYKAKVKLSNIFMNDKPDANKYI